MARYGAYLQSLRVRCGNQRPRRPWAAVCLGTWLMYYNTIWCLDQASIATRAHRRESLARHKVARMDERRHTRIQVRIPGYRAVGSWMELYSHEYTHDAGGPIGHSQGGRRVPQAQGVAA